MQKNVTLIKVFISCPSDVEKEKNIVSSVCETLSRNIFAQKNINIRTIHWEKDIPRVITGEGPQKTIDRYLDEEGYDIYFGILWGRFGKPQSNGLTPTEGEFEDALKRYKGTGKPLVKFIFKKEKLYPKNEYEASQLLSIQRFKKRIETLGLYDSFITELELQEKAFISIQQLTEKLTITKDSQILFQRIKYNEITGYIHRKIYPAEKYKPDEFWLLEDKYNEDLTNIIKVKNKITLIGDAGSGKSIELERVANYFSQENAVFYPLLIRLNTYTDQSINSLLPGDWEKIPENQLLIILDGLDEVESKNKRDFIRKIELFSERYASTTIIVSCRTNFYLSGSEQSTGTLKGFDTYILRDLQYPEIEQYVQQKFAAKTSRFFDGINKNQLQPLLKIPFYLVKLVDIFKVNNKLPNSKALIFEHLLISRITFDEDHFRKTIELNEYRNKIIRTLEYVALGMEALGRNYILNGELRKLLPDLALRDLIKHCTSWKTENEGVTWQFEHNNIQEYLAARILSHQSLEIIKNFVSFQPEYKKIIPSLVNTLSFLLSISENSELLDWILENEPEIAIKFEPDKVENPDKIKIFKDVFNYYKKRQIWIDRDKFRYDEIGRFGQLDEIIEFLLTEIEVVEHYTTLSNAIKILGTMRLPHSFKSRANDLLIKAAVNRLDNETTEHVQREALMALSTLKINSKNIIDQIITELRDSKSDWVRSGLYYFLHTSEFLDEYVDIFLEGIIYARFHVSSANIQRSRLGNERFELIEGLKKVKSPEAIIKVVSYFIDHENDLHDLFTGKHDVSFLAENASKAYLKEPSILDLAVNFSLSMLDNHLNKEAGQFMRFFKNTDTRFLAFQKTLSEKSQYKEDLLAALADDRCLEYIIEQYEIKNIPEDDIWRFIQTLRWKNKDLFVKFYENINEKFDNKFILPPDRDYEKERKERAQQDFELLFKKEKVIEEIKRIFEVENKQSFTQKEIFKLRREHWPDLYYSDLAAEILRDMARKKEVTSNDVVKYLDKWDWEWFCISKIYEKLSNNDDLDVTKKHQEWIANWCYKNLDKADFKNAVTKTGKSTYSVHWNAIYMWYFFRKFKLNYPKNILFDMISFDYDRQNIKYLEKHLGIPEIASRVLENMAEGIVLDDVLENHIDFCRRHHITDVLKFALSEIKNTQRETHDSIRTLSLKTVIELSESLSELEDLLLEINDEFRWDVIDELVERKSEAAYGFLKSLFSESEATERFKIAEYLIKYQDLDALAFYVESIKSEKKFTRSIYGTSPISSLQTIEALPLLLELLEASYHEDFNQAEDFKRLDQLVISALTNIALKSDDNYLKVKESVETFIKKYETIHKNVNWLYASLEQIEQQFYINKSEKLTIDDVIAKLEKISTGF